MSEIPDYYAPCVKNYREVNNAEAVKEWFESTEPRDGSPNHTRVLHTKVAEAIMAQFLTELEVRIIAASRYAWQPLIEPLPGRWTKRQAIAYKTPYT